LRGEQRWEDKQGGNGNRAPRDEATHELGITEAARAQKLCGSVRNLRGFCAVSVWFLCGLEGELFSKLLILRERSIVIQILRGF
jgi:hypothetical protein